jgi:nitrite reductase (NADH) large subunit
MKETIIVVGNGMVGHKFIELMLASDAADRYQIVTFCEEPHTAYDRIHLSDYFSGKTFEDLSLATPDGYRQNGVQVFVGDRVASIDREQQKVTSSKGVVIRYDRLVLATGSYPFVPPIKGKEASGTFVYRTLEDLDAIRSYAEKSKIGVVVGGGLLGLECANALKSLGLQTHVIEFAPRLMTVQIDDAGGALLRKKIEALGVQVHTNKSTTEIVAQDGKVAAMQFADGSDLATDLIVFSAGIRPRDELARESGITVGERGGIVIDESCRTSDSNIYAIGECALYKNRIYGLAAPGYQMAEAVVDVFAGVPEPKGFTGADMSTKLKLMGVDVASFGDAFGVLSGTREISIIDALEGTYKKIVVDTDGKKLMGGILVGDAANYNMLHQIMQNGLPLPIHPDDLILPSRGDSSQAGGIGVDMLPGTAKICSCENISKASICKAIADNGLTTVAEIKKCTKAGTGCGGCVALVGDILKAELKRSGVAVTNYICEHFTYSRQELFHLVKVNNIHSFEDLIERHGQGLGCEICKPAVASILASTWNDYILEKSHATLQDTNDYFLANIQRDGTYSVVPRIPGGEITPDKLIVIGQVAKQFDLYVKITGGQRIDMFGARVDQLPLIWKQLVEAGFESGHAYGKALRTVKSCVGTTWCRYGQQDSVGLAIKLEERYKGLRAPHKLKSAVSGCTRECAEAQGKDFGLIATEKGYNLFVCGNGGMKPQHAQLLAEDLDEATVVKYLDRFLMFYIRTADRLQRTANWLNNLEGGMTYLKQVILEDKLGICEELERDMENIVGTYQCEWSTTLLDEEKLKRFRHFINTDEPDPNIIKVSERGQKRPAYESERELLIPVDFIPVRP